MAAPHKKGSALFEERMLARGFDDDALGFDPTIIITLLTVILPMIQSCFKPKPASLRRRFGSRVVLIHKLRRELPHLTREEASAAVDAAFDVADDAKEEEVQGFIDECCATESV